MQITTIGLDLAKLRRSEVPGFFQFLWLSEALACSPVLASRNAPAKSADAP